jgi:hypothetical protein
VCDFQANYYFCELAETTASQQTDKISQKPENWENRNGPDLVQAFRLDFVENIHFRTL